MEFDSKHEAELRQALQRRPAPPQLKQKIMAAREGAARRRMRQHNMTWMRIAAGLLIVAIVGGLGDWGLRRQEEKRKGEEARREVMMALRITSHALNNVQQKLAEHDRAGEPQSGEVR